MRRCQDSCPKLKRKSGPSPGSSFAEETKEPKGSPKGTKSAGVESEKSAQIGGVTALEAADSGTGRNSEGSTKPAGSGEKYSPRVQKAVSPQSSERSRQSKKMSARERTYPERGKGNTDSEWNSTGHNPCADSCPTTKARDRGIRKAELRQQRLDDYLLNKGFSYFDGLCTCSSICLMYQLRRDKFVVEILKSACLFALGMKLCDELDAWNIMG